MFLSVEATEPKVGYPLAFGRTALGIGLVETVADFKTQRSHRRLQPHSESGAAPQFAQVHIPDLAPDVAGFREQHAVNLVGEFDLLLCRNYEVCSAAGIVKAVDSYGAIVITAKVDVGIAPVAG